MPKEVDAITRLYDFILWMIPRLEKFPRSQKFVLGDRIETLMLDILDHLIDAAYSKQKGVPLRHANLKLEKLRYLIRLARDMKLISLKSYEFSARSVDAIGRSVGGWLRQMPCEGDTGCVIFQSRRRSCVGPFGRPKHKTALPGRVAGRRMSGQGTRNRIEEIYDRSLSR